MKLYDKYLLNKEELIEEVESIPLYRDGKGLCLGNYTSQMFGLIYLIDIIKYVKEDLHLKYLVNFMDDFIIIHHDKRYLESCLGKIKDKLNDYKLEFNIKKTKIDNINNGIIFLGYRFLIINNKVIMKLGKRTKKSFKKKVKDLKVLYKYGFITKKEFSIMLAGYIGILNYGNCRSLYYKNINNSY